MAMTRRRPRRGEEIQEMNLTVDKFNLGYISLIEEARLPLGAASAATNLYQTQDGLWSTKWGSKYFGTQMPLRRGSAAPQEITNFILNPSFEVDLASWTNGDSTLVRDTVHTAVGVGSAKLTTTGGYGYMRQSTNIAVEAGQTYFFQASVTTTAAHTKNAAGSNISDAILYVTYPEGGDTTIARVDLATVRTDYRLSAAFTIPAGKTAITFNIYQYGSGDAWWDAVSVTKGGDVAYFDGATPDAAFEDYDWSGTAHNSTSVKSIYEQVSPHIDGATEFVRSDGTTEIVTVAGGKVYTSGDAGSTWTEITGAALTAGEDCNFLQIRGFLLIFNGVDNLVRYNGSTLATYTAISSPSTPSITKNGLTGTNYTYFYQVVATNEVGTSLPSMEVSVQVGKIRDTWKDGTDSVELSWSAVTGATRYSVFIADQSGFEVYLDSVAGTSYSDNGTVAPNVFVETPNDNTSQGPKFREAWLSGNRPWATRDPDNPWRVWWGGTGQYQLTFSSFYGGGYIDLEKGGRERPIGGRHFRDGKGGSFSTIFTSDPQGNGSTWQVALDTATIGTTSFIVPSATKVVGSIGSGAPRSIVQVGDDIMFSNTRGQYSLGSRPNLLNVLSTREVSANIRPDWKNLYGPSIDKIAAVVYDAKVLLAVPAGGEFNQRIWIQDTERRNWQLEWTLPFKIKHFLEFTDASGLPHLLVIPEGGSQLIEMGSHIKGDLGAGFSTEYSSGIIAVSPDHTKWAQLLYIYLEISRLEGKVNLEVLGEDKKKGFISLAAMPVSGASATEDGWSTEAWSTFPFSEIDKTTTTAAPLIITKRLRVNKLVKSFMVKLSSNDLSTSFTILQFQAKGFMVPTNDPSEWSKDTVSKYSGAAYASALTTEDGIILTIEG